MRSIFKQFLIVSSFIICFINLANAQTASYEDFIKQFFTLEQTNDLKTIYRDLSTSRFKSSSDFSTFQDVMTKLNADIGGVKDYHQEYKFQDNTYAGYSFYRLQYRVKNEKGGSVQRIVIMQDNDRWLLDGFAVYSQGQIKLAQGNLYGFDTVNYEMAKQQPDQAKDWLTIRDKNTFNDSATNKDMADSIKEKRQNAVLAAANGYFDEAEQLFKLLPSPRGGKFGSPDQGVIKDVKAGQLTKEVGQLYFQARKEGEIDKDKKKAIDYLQQALFLDPNFISGYVAIAGMYLADRQLDKAYTSIQKLIKLDPQNLYAHGYLTIYYKLTGEFLKAKEEAKIVLNIVADFVPLAETFVSLGFDKKYFDNGKLEFKATFVNGKANGPYKAYFSTGELQEEGQYQNGVLDGEGKVYYKNGKTEIDFKYDKGHLLYVKRYDESGNIIMGQQF